MKDLNHKADIGDHFDENKKKSARTVAKYSKQILKLIYLHYLTAPRGVRGVKRTERALGFTLRSVFALIFS